jgi:membrane fusion protein (multidrug efflux system)
MQASTRAAAAQTVAAGVKLRHATQELERSQQLVRGQVASQNTVDLWQSTHDGAAADLRSAREQEQAVQAELGNQAPVRQAEATLREAELALARCALTAPFDGVVGKRAVELGANVASGQTLLALRDDSEVWVTANFKETQIRAMNPGDPVEIEVDAFPDLVVRGHVESLAPATGAKYALLPPDNATGNFTKVVQRVPVRIALDSVDGGAPKDLPVGLSVHARVHVR